MAQYLSDRNEFEVPEENPEQVFKTLEAFNKAHNYKTGAGIVYNYGI